MDARSPVLALTRSSGSGMWNRAPTGPCCMDIPLSSTALAFTPDSRRLLSGSEDGTLGVWDVEQGQCVRIMQGYAVALYSVAWNPAGTHLATAGSDRLVIIWDATNQTPPKVFHGHRWTVFGVAWSPDGRWLASSGRDNAIRLWDPTQAQPSDPPRP